MIRINVAKEGGEVRTEPAWPDSSGNFTIPLLLLKPGWIVQAWIIEGTIDLAHSPAVAVTAVGDDLATTPATTSAQTTTRQQSAPATPGASTERPRQPSTRALRAPNPQPTVAVCDDRNTDADAKLDLADGDSAIRGSTTKVVSASGRVFVCVNGIQRQLHDTNDPTSTGGTLKASKFDVTLSDDSKLAQGNFVLVALVPDNGDRTTIRTTVGPAKPISANPCDSATKGAQTIQVEKNVLNAGVSEIKVTVPNPSGSITVCINNTQADIAAGPGPTTDTTKYGPTVSPDKNQYDLLLKTPLQQNQMVRIAWTSQDKTLRSIKDLEVQGPVLSRLILPSVPKEGETLIKVNTVKPPDNNDKSPSPVVLSVFVNQDLVTVVDKSGSDAQYVPVDSSGITGVKLKNPVDGGDCVVALEYTGPSLPASLDFHELNCDIQQTAEPVPPARGYAHSYPLLASSIFNWGRVRAYMAAGSLFSFNANNFSQASIFLAFNMTKNWIWGGPYYYRVDDQQELKKGYKRTMLETFFDARLTSLPVAACTSTSSNTTGTGGSGGGSGTNSQGSSSGASSCPSTVETFITTRKSAVLNGGVSIPFIISTWRYAHRPYAISFGPLAKVGFDTPVSDVQSGEALASQQQFYTNFGFGTRLGLYRMGYSDNVSPELESYIDIVTGRFSNFDVSPTDGSRYARPWRIGIEGVVKIPTTPFTLGIGANIHQNFGLSGSKTVDHAKDSLQFLLGARFDAGKLFSKIGSLK